MKSETTLSLAVFFCTLAIGFLIVFLSPLMVVIVTLSYVIIVVNFLRSFDIRHIPACDGGVYLTRITLLRFLGGKLMINVFRKSDEREMHDHPWNFWSLIIWRGYIEHLNVSGRPPESGYWKKPSPVGCIIVRRRWPGMILRRRTYAIHRVQLVNYKPAVSLVWRGPHKRVWGFHTTEGWLDHVAWWRKNCAHNTVDKPYISSKQPNQ